MGFVGAYNADGEEDFLSANGKTRKAKRAQKKADKEEKLRKRKGTEISSSIASQMGGMMGMPVMIPTKSETEEKKGLGKLVSNFKDKREQRQADKLFKKDVERSKKAGTLSKAEFKEPSEKKSVNITDAMGKGLGIVKGLILGEEEEEEVIPKKKPASNADIAKWVILGLGVTALVVLLVNKKSINKGGAQK